METKFKAGDKFIPRKPKEDYSELEWVSNMDKYDGKELIVESIFKWGEVQCPVVDEWVFHPDWCEKLDQFPEVRKMVEPMKAGIEGISKNMVEGLKQYFKNTSKEEVLKVWEATKEEDFPIYNHIKASTLLPQPQTWAVTIDWEQRKWEASVAMMQGLLATGLVPIEEDAEVSTAVSDCIRVVNEMIKQLKGE